jgi:hypothetical protein
VVGPAENATAPLGPSADCSYPCGAIATAGPKVRPPSLLRARKVRSPTEVMMRGSIT